MIRGIFFDIRALLYGPSDGDFLSEVLRDEGIKVEPIQVTEALAALPPELLAARRAMRTEEQEDDYDRAKLRPLLKHLGVEKPTPALLLRLAETVHEYHAYHSLYPEALPVLEELRNRGLVMAVVANWMPSLKRLLQEFELDGYFRGVVASQEVGVAKPDPRIFWSALESTRLTTGSVLHVGPSLTEDVAGAAKAGIRPVWLNRTGLPAGPEVMTVNDLRGMLLLAQNVEEH